jgi:hypothetical protein
MIRIGSFGTNFEIKLLCVFLIVIVCIYDWKIKKRADYWWILITGTIVWTLVEFYLQRSSIRLMEAHTLFGAKIPFWFSILIQGSSEGATIAIIGIFFGDRLLEKKTRYFWGMIYILLTGVVIFLTWNEHLPSASIGQNVSSRREIFNPLTVSLLVGITIFDLLWLRRLTGEIRNRGWMMIGVIIFSSTCWTIAAILANTRFIEMGLISNLHRAPLGIEAAGFFWDVVVELGFAYLLFFAIPMEFGLIKTANS